MSTVCSKCNTLLYAGGIPQGQQVRCENCSNRFRLGEAVKVSADSLAWRSFWLGLASLVLLFLTGIPAIYYGIRSLLRMRFIKHGPRDRFAAIAGVLMGTVFGLFGGSIIVVFGLIVAFAYTSLDVSNKPVEIDQRFDSVFEQPSPSGLSPSRAANVFKSQYFFDYVDDKISGQRNVRVHFIHCKPNMRQTNSQIIGHLRRRTVTSANELEEKDSAVLNWEMGGQEVDVRRILYDIVSNDSDDVQEDLGQTDQGQTDQENVEAPPKKTNPDNTLSNEVGSSDANSDEDTKSSSFLDEATQVVLYFGFYSDENGTTGMSVATRFPNPKLTEAQIKSMFAEVKHRAQ